MSRISIYAHNATNATHHAMSKAMTEIAAACDDADRWLANYEKDKQCTADDLAVIIAARIEVDRIRKLRLK